MDVAPGLMLQAARINESKLVTSKSILALINLFIFWLISSCHDHVLFCYDTVRNINKPERTRILRIL
jgi:hypothetical protein